MRLGAIVLLATSCAGAPRPRVAVLPEVWATTRPESAQPAAPRITKTLTAHEVSAVDDSAARAALAAEGAGCVDDLGCLRRVGERLGATKVVTLQLAELGETLAVQATLVDVQRAAREATMREVIKPNEASRVAIRLDELGTRVARQAGPAPRARSHWWWLGAGGLAAGVTVVTALVLASGGADPDAVIVPP